MSAGDRDTLADDNVELVEALMDALSESLFCQPKGELRAVEYSDVFDAAKDVLAVIASSDWLAARVRAAQAQGWEEGHSLHAGCIECWDDGYGDQINPYRLGDTEQSNHKVDGRESEKHT